MDSSPLMTLTRTRLLSLRDQSHNIPSLEEVAQEIVTTGTIPELSVLTRTAVIYAKMDGGTHIFVDDHPTENVLFDPQLWEVHRPKYWAKHCSETLSDNETVLRQMERARTAGRVVKLSDSTPKGGVLVHTYELNPHAANYFGSAALPRALYGAATEEFARFMKANIGYVKLFVKTLPENPGGHLNETRVVVRFASLGGHEGSNHDTTYAFNFVPNKPILTQTKAPI